MENIIGSLIVFFYFALPVAAVIWFVVSLIRYFKAKPQREEQPNRFRKRRNRLIASAITAAVLVGLCVGIIAMLAAAVAHM